MTKMIQCPLEARHWGHVLWSSRYQPLAVNIAAQATLVGRHEPNQQRLLELAHTLLPADVGRLSRKGLSLVFHLLYRTVYPYGSHKLGTLPANA
jgi:hypothetical protein